MTLEELEQQSKLGTLILIQFQQLIWEFDHRFDEEFDQPHEPRFAAFSKDSGEEDPEG